MPDSIESVWNLRGATCQLNSRGLVGAVDFAQPQRGLTQTVIDGVPIADGLLSIGRNEGDPNASIGGTSTNAWPLSLNEVYVRGCDLVASYSASEEWPYAPQIYWRAGTLNSVDGVRDSLALLISVQTHLLDTRPQINVRSQIAADEIVRVIPIGELRFRIETLSTRSRFSISPESAPCCVLWRLTGGRTSYAEIMLENDFHRLEINGDQNRDIGATWHVFADFLEKGVIRRARLQSVILPRENDVELAAACCRAIERRPLPLTT